MDCFWKFFCDFWSTIGGHVTRHSEAYGTGAIAGGLSIAKNMPPSIPKSPQELWTWIRDSVQTALPISRNNSNPILPVPPAQPQGATK